MDKLKDMLKKHIYNGLSETYRTVNQMTGGQRTLMAFQVALDGIRDLSKSKLDTDYRVLLTVLNRNNFTENLLELTIRSAFYEYARRALQNAGLNCKNLNLNLIDVLKGAEFVHSVYINAAREIWMQPHLFSHEYAPNIQLENQRKTLIIIEQSIEKSVRDGVDLNKIITAYQTGTVVERRKVKEPTLKEKFNMLNRERNILDDSYDTADDREDYVIKAAQSISTEPERSHMFPPTPSTTGIATIDNDELAPDDETIDTFVSEKDQIKINFVERDDDEAQTILEKQEQDDEATIEEVSNITPTHNPQQIETTEQQNEAIEQQDETIEQQNEAIEQDNETEYTVTTVTSPKEEESDKMHFKITLGKSDLVSLQTEEDERVSETESDDDIVSVRTILPKFKASKTGRIALRRNKIPESESELGTESVLTVVSEKQPYKGMMQPLNKLGTKANANANVEKNVIDMTGGGSEEDIMLRNVGKPKSKPQPEIEEQSEELKIELNSTEQSAEMLSFNSINLRLLDENDAMSSRLDRLNRKKQTVINLEM